MHRGHLLLSWMLAGKQISPPCVSFVLVWSRKDVVDFSPTTASEILVSCSGIHIPIHSFTEHGWCKIQKCLTLFIETEREVVSWVILLFRQHNRHSETGSQAVQCLQIELAALHISHSAFCVHSIISALIITHARTQFHPHICASPCTIILLWQKPRLCLCGIYVFLNYVAYIMRVIVYDVCDCACMHRVQGFPPRCWEQLVKPTHCCRTAPLEGYVSGFIT